MIQAVNLNEKFNQIQEFWSPHVVGELNGQHVKLARLKGTFVWHHHEHEDELFMVIKGELVIQFETHEVTLRPGSFCIVPKGVSHRPVAVKEVEVLLFEPATTLNTGNIENELTRSELRHL